MVHDQNTILDKSRTREAAVSLSNFSSAARARLLAVRREPLLIADWLRVAFLHFEADPDALQRVVPFELDLRQGRAYVSLVAFTMRGLRPRRGGKVAALLFKPIATHRFLNVRTYVKHHGEPGIHFMTEWLDNPLSVLLGPPVFGLPYRFGRLIYDHDPESRTLRGCVTPGFMPPGHDATRNPSRFEFSAAINGPATFRPCDPGSLDEFLLERYTAFNGPPPPNPGTRRFFRIWHPPWPQIPVEMLSLETGLLEKVWPWFANARLVGAHFSPSLHDVWMGRPHAVSE